MQFYAEFVNSDSVVSKQPIRLNFIAPYVKPCYRLRYPAPAEPGRSGLGRNYILKSNMPIAAEKQEFPNYPVAVIHPRRRPVEVLR